MSPYPTVVVVWIAHQSPDPIDGYRSCSATVIKTPAPMVTTIEAMAITTAAPRGVVARATAASSRRSSLVSCGNWVVGLGWSRHPASLVAHSKVWIAKATANPRVVAIPASLPPCSNASGIIVSASIVRIAPAAKASTKATVSGEESWNSA